MNEVNAVTTRDRITGGLLVLVVVAAQARLMGRATALLSVALVVSYLLWAAALWNSDPENVLPMYLLAIAVQCLHFTEEFAAGFQREFPKLAGNEWSDAQFVAFNLGWIAVFVLAGIGVYRRVPLAWLVVLFLAVGGGVANGAGHLLLSAMQGKYFPGAATAPLCLLVGITLLVKLFGGTRGRQERE
ncbi:MAG: HXXEE domain-containing protein [Candidatus Acidiferrales bacterium]